MLKTTLLTAATDGLCKKCFTERISEVILCVSVFLLHYLVFIQVGMSTFVYKFGRWSDGVYYCVPLDHCTTR